MDAPREKIPLNHPVVFEQPWALALGAAVGVMTLIFLMAIVILAINGKSPPDSVQNIIIAIISFGLAFSTAFLGGRAIIKGVLPFIPDDKSVEFSMAGGVAVFLIVFVVLLKLWPAYIAPDWDGGLSTLNSAIAKVSDVDDKVTVKINGDMLVDADYGFSGSFEFKDKLKVGENLIEVSVFNGGYGGCSGTLQTYFNDKERKSLSRSYTNNYASANQVCKTFTLDFPVKS